MELTKVNGTFKNIQKPSKQKKKYQNKNIKTRQNKHNVQLNVIEFIL